MAGIRFFTFYRVAAVRGSIRTLMNSKCNLSRARSLQNGALVRHPRLVLELGAAPVHTVIVVVVVVVPVKLLLRLIFTFINSLIVNEIFR